jgi:hypothetical protein
LLAKAIKEEGDMASPRIRKRLYRAVVANSTPNPTKDAAKIWRMRRTTVDRSTTCRRTAAANAP